MKKATSYLPEITHSTLSGKGEANYARLFMEPLETPDECIETLAALWAKSILEPADAVQGFLIPNYTFPTFHQKRPLLELSNLTTNSWKLHVCLMVSLSAIPNFFVFLKNIFLVFHQVSSSASSFSAHFLLNLSPSLPRLPEATDMIITDSAAFALLQIQLAKSKRQLMDKERW